LGLLFFSFFIFLLTTHTDYPTVACPSGVPYWLELLAYLGYTLPTSTSRLPTIADQEISDFLNEEMSQNGKSPVSPPTGTSSSGNPSATQQTSKAWLFTLNNHSSVDVPRSLERVKYVIWQEEKGHETATKHLQGYVIFDCSKTLGGLKRIWPTAHWEIRRGTHEQARDYCSKSDTRVSGPWTLGTPPVGAPSSGDRAEISGLNVLKRMIDDGASDRDLWDANFKVMLKFHNGTHQISLPFLGLVF
jgi:Putative viral replication protein